MGYQIHKAVVVGSGTMGAAIAAHLANAGMPVTLLDIVPNEAALGDKRARDKIVQEGWDRCLKARPANLMSADLKSLVRLGNIEDDFETIAEADWVIEAVVENLSIKRELMGRIDEARGHDCIVSTNTSGIRIEAIAADRSTGFKEHFLGTHFFNPPRYLKLLEIIPGAHTLPAVIGFIGDFAEIRLGKGVVLCKDTPNFIGNRIFFGQATFAMNFILENDYGIEEVDAVTGPLMGRPKTATFRLADLVGIDVWEHVGENLGPAIPHDKLAQQYIAAERPKVLLRKMVERNWLGNKTGVGFYKAVRRGTGSDSSAGSREFWPLDLKTLSHAAPSKVRFESVEKAKEAAGLGERLKIMLDSDDKAARLVRTLTYQGFQYAASLLPEVADTPAPIDDAVRWGFGHEAGPFEMWDMLGVKETTRRMKAAGFAAPKWVSGMLKSGKETFYQYREGAKTGAYDISEEKYMRLVNPKRTVVPKGQDVIEHNAGATLYNLGDGVACVDLHTKMNALDEDIFSIMSNALDRTDKDFEGLVISTQAENFSAGANLFMVVVAAQQGMWDTLDSAIRRLQCLNMRMRYFSKPIVVAPAGLALGGGCEIVMHAGRVVAAAETYTGLVEVGAGVIPAGGGTKEILRRLINPPMRTVNAEVLPHLQRAFLQIGQARVASSAEDARQLSFLMPQDRIVMNRDHLLSEAKREVLHMTASGHHPPAPEEIFVGGRDMLGALRTGVFMFNEGKYISEHDAKIAEKLAYVMCGGELTSPQWVGEQYILDLEREAFLSLCGEEKSQARMWSILQTGKPLRN